MSYTIVNLEQGRPTAQAAMQRLSQELRIAKAYRVGVLKVIHGYGSTGEGGVIRSETLRLLAARRGNGQIRAYVPGEDFSIYSSAAREILAKAPELRKDRDYGRGNLGITMVLL